MEKEHTLSASSFRNLKIHTLKLFSELGDFAHSSDVHAVENLIDNIRGALAPSDKQLGVWETAELNYANHALKSGFPKLALIAAGKAMAVSQLSTQEYDFGFDYIRQQSNTFAENVRAQVEIKQMWNETIKALLAEQSHAAAILVQSNEEAARRLEFQEEMTAADLRQHQQMAAIALALTNQAEADALQKLHEENIITLKAEEVKRLSQQQDVEQIMAWLAGGYSIECPACPLCPESTYVIMIDAHQKAALDLKQRQKEAADALLEEQQRSAEALRESEREDARRLKQEQKEAALKLREEETIRILRQAGAAESKPAD